MPISRPPPTRSIEVVAAAQRERRLPEQLLPAHTPGREFHDLEWGHELYTAGHLVQAAIAWKRAVNDDRLLAVATRVVERIRAELGVGRRELIDGHPEIEMALVELFRTTGDEQHLELAGTLLERRGRGLLRPDRFGAGYWQDHEPVRAARHPSGHAVRQMYLDCGAVDVAVETHDRELLEAVIARWESMIGSRTYLTGGLGARQRDEAFGEAFELPPDLAYAETCAAIGSVMLAWRLLLATGEPRFADVIERTSLNAVLAGLALDGDRFLYANPLLVRHGSEGGSGPIVTRRQPWFACACCPPNLMRFLATFPDMLATGTDDGVRLHQFATATIEADGPSGRIGLEVETSYPWSGDVVIAVVDAPAVPVDAPRSRPRLVPGRIVRAGSGSGCDPRWRRRAGVHAVSRPGLDTCSELSLDMPARITAPDPRIDAVRGTVAIERGPLVYALEEADLSRRGNRRGRWRSNASLRPTVAEPDPSLPGMTFSRSARVRFRGRKVRPGPTAMPAPSPRRRARHRRSRCVRFLISPGAIVTRAACASGFPSRLKPRLETAACRDSCLWLFVTGRVANWHWPDARFPRHGWTATVCGPWYAGNSPQGRDRRRFRRGSRRSLIGDPGRPCPPRRPQAVVTMRDVANATGVSQSTVSRVLSGAPTAVPIAAQTRDRVLAAARRSRLPAQPAGARAARHADDAAGRDRPRHH